MQLFLDKESGRWITSVEMIAKRDAEELRKKTISEATHVKEVEKVEEPKVIEPSDNEEKESSIETVKRPGRPPKTPAV
jgi:hypothetical protein